MRGGEDGKSGQSLDFEGEAEGEEDFDDDHNDGKDIRRAEQADHQRHDGDEDGKDQVRLRLVQPREGHEVGAEDHRIYHQHLVRHGGKDPHRYENIKQLVDTEKDTSFCERVAFSFEVNAEGFGQSPGEGEQDGGTAENDEVFLLDGEFSQLDYQDEAPYDDGGQYEMQAFLLAQCAVFS